MLQHLLTEITSLTILLIVKGSKESLTVRVSKQILESPSMMILVHPSVEARLMAQNTEVTSAWIGRQLICFFTHSLIGISVWSLARTASAVDVEPTVASTLSLMVSAGGGDQDVGEAGGIVCTSRLCRLENSATLREMRFLDERLSILLSSKVNWFHESQISSRVTAKVVVMCFLSTSCA